MDELVVAWSGGKDCALVLHELLEAGHEVVELLTTINREYDRSTMHGVRRELYEHQAEALGVPLNLVSLPPEPSNEAYERGMARELDRYRERGVERVVFADIFLEDVREYREGQLADSGVEGVWPLWGGDTRDLVERFLELGFEAIVVAADAELFDAPMVGRPLDADFLSALPADVDPCGEHGEFHTFVWDGPVFDQPVSVDVGAVVTRAVGDGEFHYADLELADRP